MSEQKKKVKKYFFPALFRFVVAGLSILIFVVLAAQITLWAGVLWLRAEGGQTWLENNLSKLAEESGYVVKVRDINGLTWSGINIGTLNVSDKIGSVLDGEQIRLRIGIPSLFSKSLSLSVTAESLALHRLPEEKKDNTASTFLVPDVYFNALYIDKLSVKKLTLSKDVIGNDMETSVDLSAKAEKSGGDIIMDLSLKLSQTKDNFLPERIDAVARFSPEQALLTTTNITVTSPFYNITSKGTVGLKDNSSIDFEIHGDTSRLPGMSGAFTADGRITGSLQKPEFEVAGVLKLTGPAADDLDDIRFTVTSDRNLVGHIDIKTAYQKNDATIGADFLYGGSVLRLKEINVAAPDLVLTGFVDYNISTALASGRTEVSILFDRYKDILKTDVSGHGKATLVLSEMNGLQAADVSLKIEKIQVQDVLAETAEVNAAYADIRSLWPDSAELLLENASSGDAVINKLKAVLIRATEKPFYALSLEGKGKYRKPFTLTGTADLEGNSVETAVARNISLVILPSKGELEVTGSLIQQNIDLTIKPKNVPFNTLPASMPETLNNLKMSGTVQVKDTLASPSIKAELDLNPIQIPKKMPSISMKMKGSYVDGKAIADISAKGNDIKTLQAHAEMPFVFSMYPFSVGDIKNNDLQAAIVADLELRAIAAAILPVGMALSGRINADIKTSGALESPVIAGNILFSDGAFIHEESDTALKDIDMSATLDGETLHIESLKAQDKKNGKVIAKGKVGINKEIMPVELLILVDKLNPFRSTDLVSGDFSGDVVLSGDKKLYTVSGKITTDKISVTIPDRFNSAVPRLNIVKKNAKEIPAPDFAKSVKLDLKLVAEKQVFVRGHGLDAEFGGSINISGTLAEPLYNGAFKSKRGRYEEFGKQFDLKRALLRFQGAVPPSPYLDILAETKVQDITAQISLSGNVEKPTVKLSSIPDLPQDEVLSRILFGKNMTKISPFQAVQLTNSLRRFSGNGGSKFEPLSLLRKKTGLDDLQVERDEDGETTIGAGKYITDKVYLEAKAGSGENSGAAKVKIDLTPNVKAESKIGQDSNAGGGIFWQWDY